MTSSQPRLSWRLLALLAAFSALALLGAVPVAAAPSSIGNYSDQFSFINYNNSQGSLDWSGDSWVEWNDDGSPWTGAFKISGEMNCPGTLCLVAGRDGTGGSGITRNVDLSAASSATLEYEYQRHTHPGGSGKLRISVQSGGGGGWTTLAEYDLDASDSSPVVVQHDLTNFISSNTAIEFHLIGSNDESHINFDYVTIELFGEDNLAPVLDPIASQTIPEQVPFSFTASATDPNGGDVLDFTLDGSEPVGASMTSEGVFTWTPTEAQGPGIYSFDVIVTDDGDPAMQDSQTVTLTVEEVNAAPTLDPVGDRFATEGSQLAFTVTGSDPETAQAELRFELYGSPPAGASMTPGGDFSWTPTEMQGPGSYDIEIKLWDDGEPALYDYELITVTVAESNRAPSIAAIPTQTVDEGTLLRYTVSVSDPDKPVNGFRYSLSGAPAGASIDAAGTVTWTPNDAQGPGSYTFDVVVADDGSPVMTVTASMTVNVLEANIAPTVTPIAAQSVAEGATLTFTASATDPDAPANNFTFSMTGAPAGAAITPGGTFTWTPTEVHGPGVFIFDVIATDDGSPAMSGSAEVSVTVTEVNTPPSLAPVEAQNIDEGTAFSLQLVATDSDVPSNNLTYALRGAPSGVTVSAFGVLAWTPAEDQGPGNYVFDVTVSDNGSPNLTATQPIIIYVNDANNAPVIDPISSKTVVEGDTVTFTAKAVDPDVPANTFWFRLGGSIPAGASMSSSGEFTWSPNEVQGPGSYKFDVVVTDTGSPSRSSSRSVTITVLEDNQAPSLNVASSHSAEAGLPFVLQLNATDADLPAQQLTFSASSLPDGAAVAGSVLTWIPTEEQVGNSYGVDITVTDSGSPQLAATEKITIEVITANRAPVLAPIGDKTATVGEMLSFIAEATDGDDPPDLLTFSLSSDAPAGARIDAMTGAFEWRPRAAQNNAAYRFAVLVTDNGAVPKSDAETITVAVGTPNASPIVATPAKQVSTPGENVTLELSASDPDAYPLALVFSAEDLPPGLVIDATSGMITGRIGFDGLAGSPHLVTVTVDDGAAQVRVDFLWEVNGVGDPGAATPTRSAVVSSISEVRAAPAVVAEPVSDIGRTLVLMARAVRVGADDVAMPFLLLVIAIGVVVVFGRIGLVPILKRGRREEGMILSYDPLAGTGLVARHSDGGEVFVHATSIARRDRKTLVTGDPVDFRTVDGAYRDLVTKLRKRR